MADTRDRDPRRLDERDTMFARAARRPGTPEHEDYYRRRPELRAIDQRIRALPELLAPGGRHYDAGSAREAAELFAEIDRVEPDRRAVDYLAAALSGPDGPSGTLEAGAVALGALAAGCAPVGPEHVYSHKGRLDESYGRQVSTRRRHALVFLVEMGHDVMQEAPLPPVIVESARQYLRAAVIAKTLEAALRAAGHDAVAHYDAHYEVILPPLAVEAGLGELGRNNILVADRHGSRVRIGAVTTSLALAHDRPVSLGVHAFCELCKKCSESCPSRALSSEERVEVRGVLKWPTKVEKCYAHWRRIGTDCGICMAVCPFSHRDGPLHSLVRRFVRLGPLAAKLALAGDDLVYGRRWRRARRRARDR